MSAKSMSAVSMGPVFLTRRGSGLWAATASGEHISRSDVEDSLRSLTKGARDTIGAAPVPPAVAGALAGLLAIALAYLLGRRRGRRRATVLEIRRA